MARIVVAMLFFVAVFVGLGLGALGVPSEVAVATGLIVTGVALIAASRQEAVKERKERLPVNVTVVGAAFTGIGVLLFGVGLSM